MDKIVDKVEAMTNVDNDAGVVDMLGRDNGPQTRAFCRPCRGGGHGFGNSDSPRCQCHGRCAQGHCDNGNCGHSSG